MRKRKSPIVLITTLAVMCSVAFGLQFAASKGSANQPPPPPEMPDVKAVGTPRAPEATSTVANNIKSAMGSDAAPEAPPMGAPKGRPGEPTGPMVLNPAMPAGKPEKPKPNSSSTSAHWYDKDSMAANEG